MSRMIRLNASLSASLAVGLLICAGPVHAQTTDPVVLSFSTVGDSRLDPAKDDSTQKPMTTQDYNWLQNSKAWSRIMREISAKKSNLLFFNGDMIMGYGNASLPATLPADATAYMNTDLARYYTQSAYWRGMVATLMEAGTYVVPVAGNHETQCRTGVVTTPAGLTPGITANTQWASISCANVVGTVLPANTSPAAKIAMASNENAWRANFGDLIIDTTRLNGLLQSTGLSVSNVNGTTASTAPGASDGLVTDQSKLSYSFDVGTSHFAVINTDPAGADTTAPNAWLQSDLSAARSRGAVNFFVFGHKPAYTYTYPGSSASGLDTNTQNGVAVNRDAFWQIIESFGATYFCGHEHIYNISQPTKADNTQSTAWQVLVGSGGSPFDNAAALTASQPVTDRYYAWANVKVFQSGKVQIDAYGFSDTYGPTKLLKTITLAH